MILSNALNSARALRSSKYTAVCRAETFSATAVAMNWFMLVPSSLLNRSTAFLSDFGSRRGYVFVSVMGLILLISNSPYRFPREQQVHAKSRWRRSEIPQIERHQRVHAAVYSRFKHQFVARVAKLRPPEEMCLNRLRQGVYRVYKDIHLSTRKPRRQLMLGLGTDGFIFERQSDAEQQRCLALPRCPQNGGRRAS